MAKAEIQMYSSSRLVEFFLHDMRNCPILQSAVESQQFKPTNEFLKQSVFLALRHLNPHSVRDSSA